MQERMTRVDVQVNELASNSPQPGDDAPLDTIRAANSTNLHVHGIYDSPAHDDTFVAVDPGCKHTWTYAIDVRFGSSLMFYHPHFEGSQAMQLFGGMLGAFVVEHPAHEELFAAWDTHLLLVQAIDLDSAQKDSIAVMESMASGLPLQLENPNKVQGLMLLTNEQLAPRVQLKAGTPARLRLVNGIAGAPGMLRLALQTGIHNPPSAGRARSSSASDEQGGRGRRGKGSRDSAGRGGAGAEAPEGCTMEVLALDGIFLDEPRRQKTVLLPPGGRIELAVRCATVTGPVQLVTTSSDKIGNAEMRPPPAPAAMRTFLHATTLRRI
jgi:FtsP/CotA-like multicopper oxidase with cupredoxin domain